jgi:phosphohistidine swiveling domain-containing protein
VDWFRERRDLVVLNCIRSAFKNQFFLDIEIWRLLGTNVTLSYWERSKGNTTKYNAVFYFLYYFFFVDFIRLLKLRKYNKGSHIEQIGVFVEALSDEARVRGLWLPVVEGYVTGNAAIITNKKELYNKYQNDHKVLILKSFSFFKWIKSRWFILKFIIKNFKFLFIEKKKFQPLSSFGLINIVILQISTILKFDWLIIKYNPRAYLTIWDWYALGSAAVNTFKSYKIPTFTFIHGAAGKEALKEFLPLNADYILSWGKHNTKSLIELGLHHSQILEVGCPRMHQNSSYYVEMEQVDKRIIMVLLTAILDPCFINDIIKINNKYENIFNIHVRLHPSTAISDIDLRLKSANITIITKNDETLEQSLDKAFAIVLDTSSAGFDAVNMDKPVFVIDSSPVKRNQDIMDDIIKFEAAVFSDSLEDFSINFESFLNDASFQSQLAKNRKLFSSNFIAAYSDDSAKLISKAITELMR